MTTTSTTDLQTIQTTQTKTAGFSLAALGSTLTLEKLNGNLFEELLSQIAATDDSSASSSSADSTSAAASSDKTTSTSDANSDDLSALRSLMQRIRDDAKALYENRQRIKHVESSSSDGKASSATEDNSSDKAATADASSAEKSAATTTKKTTATEEDDKTDDEKETASSKAENAIPLVAAPLVSEQTLPATDQGTSTDASADADAVDAQAVLQDMLQAEQAALALLNKMRTSKSADGSLDSTASQAADLGSATAATLATDVTQALTPDTFATTMSGASLNSQTSSASKKQTGGKEELFTPLSSTEGTTQTAEVSTSSGDDALAALTQTSNAQDGEDPSAKPSDGAGTKNLDNNFLSLFNASATVSTATTSATGVSSQSGSFKVDAAGTGGLTSSAGLGEASAQGSAASTSSTATMVGEGVKSAGSYDFASQLSAARVTKGGAAGLPTAIEQVALQLHKQVKAGNDEMTVQLRPAELGRVEIKLSFSSDNSVQGTVVADSQATLDLLSKDVGSLQRALQEAGLRADSNCLQFSLRGDGQTYSDANNNGGGSAGNSASSDYALAEVEGESLDDTMTEVYYLTPGRVNIHV